MNPTEEGGPRDRGDVVLGWLTRLVVLLAAFGVLGYDVIALGVGRFAAEDHAQSAADAAARVLDSGAGLQAAYEAALGEVDAATEAIAPADFAAGPDGSVTLTVHRTSETLLVDRVGLLRDWSTSRVTVTGRPSL